VTGLKGGPVTCEDVTIKLSISLPILEGCLTATYDKWKNGKSISSIDTGRASIEHGAKTDADLASPPGGDHPAISLGAPRAAGARPPYVRTRVPVMRSEARLCPRMRRPRRLGDQGGPGRWRSGPDRLEDRVRIRADDVYPEGCRSTH
jgi:hypothetical protein